MIKAPSSTPDPTQAASGVRDTETAPMTGSTPSAHFPNPMPAGARVNFDDASALPSVLSSTADAVARAEHAQAMSEFSIRYDGRRYEYDGYHYDRVTDALAYANLVSARAWQKKAPPQQAAAVQVVPVPSDADRRVMDALAIEFEAGIYRFQEFHYDRLADAVNYANLMARRPEDDGGR